MWSGPRPVILVLFEVAYLEDGLIQKEADMPMDVDEELLKLYYRVLNVVEGFLKQIADLPIVFDMDDLRNLNPNAEVVAKGMRQLSVVLHTLMGGNHTEENIRLNIMQCCLSMESIAQAIVAADMAEFERIVRELEMHTSSPY